MNCFDGRSSGSSAQPASQSRHLARQKSSWNTADLDRTACAILDMKLPGMNGLDLQQRLITSPRPMPIVFVSAHDEAITRANALRAGAIAFLKKPFDNSTLLDALNRSIG